MSPTLHPLIIGGCSATLHLPVGSPHGVVVMVNTFGYEGAYTVRAWTAWGEDLTHAGIGLLRFDLPDQGDSFDLAPESDATSAWLDSVDAMVDWIREHFVGAPVGLCGYRLGALIAAQAARRIPDLCGLSLIAPVVTGRHFERELKLYRQFDPSAPGIHQEGWWLSAASLRTIKGWTLDHLDPGHAPPVLALADTGLQALGQWLGRDVPHRIAACDDLDKLRNEPHLVEVPESTFAELVRWWRSRLTTTDLRPVGSRRPADPGSWPTMLLELEGCHEDSVRFGTDRQWPGTWCLPSPAMAPRRSLLILNTGSNPRSGHGRLSVVLARTLARQGVASLRVDGTDIGESTPALRGVCHSLNRSSGFQDIQAALDEMERRGWPNPVVFGLCSGAYHAYRLALEDPRLSGLVLANLYSFLFEDRTEHKAPDAGQPSSADLIIKPVESYFGIIRTRAFWTRFIHGQVNFVAVLREILHTYRKRLVIKIQRVAPGLEWLEPRAGRIQREVRELAEVEMPILFVYGNEDPGLNDLTSVFGREGRHLKLHKTFSISLVPDSTHTFDSTDSLQVLVQRVSHFMSELPLAPKEYG